MQEPDRDRRKQVIAAGSAGILIVSLVGGALVLNSTNQSKTEPTAFTIGEDRSSAPQSIISTPATKETPTTSRTATATVQSNDPAIAPFDLDDLQQIEESNRPIEASSDQTIIDSGADSETVDAETDIDAPGDTTNDDLSAGIATDDDYGFFDSPEDSESEHLDDYGFIEVPDDLGAEDLDDYGFIEVPDDLGAEDLDDYGFTDPVDEPGGDEPDDTEPGTQDQPDAADKTGMPADQDEQDNTDAPAADEPDRAAIVPTPVTEIDPTPTPVPSAPDAGEGESTPSPPAVAGEREGRGTDPGQPVNDQVNEHSEPPLPVEETPEPDQHQPAPAVTDRATAQLPDDGNDRAAGSGGILDTVQADTNPLDIQLTVEASHLVIGLKVTESILDVERYDEPINWIIRLWDDHDPANEIYSMHITRINANWSVSILKVDNTEAATKETGVESKPDVTSGSLRFSFPLEKLPRLQAPFTWTAIIQLTDHELFWQDATIGDTPGVWTTTQPEERIH